MPSKKEYLDFVLEQLSGLNDVSYRAMMGSTSSTAEEKEAVRIRLYH